MEEVQKGRPTKEEQHKEKIKNKYSSTKVHVDTCREIGKEMNIDPNLVHKIASFQLKFVSTNISKGNLEGFVLRYFGKFVVKPTRLLDFPRQALKFKKLEIIMMIRRYYGKRMNDKAKQIYAKLDSIFQQQDRYRSRNTGDS